MNPQESQHITSIRSRMPGISLASKLIILSVALILGISVLFWYPSIRHMQKEELGKNINFAETQMDVMERALFYGMLTNNREFIKQTIESLATMENILWVRIVDSGGTVRFSSIRGEFNARAGYGGNIDLDTSREKRLSAVREIEGQKVLEMIQPIRNTQPCYSAACHFHAKDLDILGRIESGYSLRSVDSYIRRQSFTVAGFGFVFIAVLSIPLYLIVNRFVLRPVSLLTRGIQRVAAGDLSQAIELDTKDELGMLAGSFNFMMKQLRDRSDAVTRELDEYRSSLLHAQKMEAIGTLSAGIAHDFNNILTGIMGYSEIAHEESSQPHVKEYMNKVLELTGRATEFTKQILLIGRKLPPARQPLDINGLVDGAVKMLRRMVEENIEIRVFPGEDLHMVNADQAQMTQVMMNLVVNARDAIQNSGVIEIKTREVCVDEVYGRLHDHPRPGNYAVISVSDTGCGIPEEIRDRIFEPFFTTKAKGRGTGLGLAVSYSIVKAHGGWMNLSSEAGKGSEFRVYLPALSARADAARHPGQQEIYALPRGTERVLLVDDDEAIRSLGRSMLTKLGYNVVLARDGEEAVTVYREHGREISLVIMDRIMPKVDGIESYRLLKELDPDVKVIISSGYAADEAKNLRESGVLGFLDKPYRLSDMANMVRSAIDS